MGTHELGMRQSGHIHLEADLGNPTQRIAVCQDPFRDLFRAAHQ
jgi:hypothetical protein